MTYNVYDLPERVLHMMILKLNGTDSLTRLMNNVTRLKNVRFDTKVYYNIIILPFNNFMWPSPLLTYSCIPVYDWSYMYSRLLCWFPGTQYNTLVFSFFMVHVMEYWFYINGWRTIISFMLFIHIFWRLCYTTITLKYDLTVEKAFAL